MTDVKAALAALEQNEKERVEAMRKAVAAAMKEYGCEVVGVPVITQDGRIAAEVRIVPSRT